MLEAGCAVTCVCCDGCGGWIVNGLMVTKPGGTESDLQLGGEQAI